MQLPERLLRSAAYQNTSMSTTKEDEVAEDEDIYVVGESSWPTAHSTALADPSALSPISSHRGAS